MGRRQCRVPAQFDLDGRRKPAELKTFLKRKDKGRFRKIHFGGNARHPAIFALLVKKTDGGGIARERSVRECVDHQELHRGLLLVDSMPFGAAQLFSAARTR
jgi:hypothetical protein